MARYPCRRGFLPQRLRAIRRIVFVGVVLLPAGAKRTNAQELRGRLLDLETNRPIPAGVLVLLDADSSVITTAVSSAEGVWQLNVPRVGTYYVTAERIGYESWVAGPVELEAEDVLNSVFHLRPLPIALEPIEVQAAAIRRHLEYNGFFQRQRGNFGHFVTPEAIERRQAAKVTDILSAIPGVQLMTGASGNVGPVQIHLRGSNLSHGGLCRPRIFVDGLIYNRGDSRPVRLRDEGATEQAVEDALRRTDDLSLDDIGHPTTLAAIEVYRSASQVPVQFGGSSVATLCGVVVVWTRTGLMRVGGR